MGKDRLEMKDIPESWRSLFQGLDMQEVNRIRQSLTPEQQAGFVSEVMRHLQETLTPEEYLAFQQLLTDLGQKVSRG